MYLLNVKYGRILLANAKESHGFYLVNQIRDVNEWDPSDN